MALRERGPKGGKRTAVRISLRDTDVIHTEEMRSIPCPRTTAAAALFLATGLTLDAAVVTFDSIALPASGYQNGSLAGDGFTLGGATFLNLYDSQYDSWAGFAFSNHTDTTTAGYLNQYSAYPGTGAGGSANYAVGFYASYFAVSTSVSLGSLTNVAGLGASFTNTTYTALSMLDGGFPAKRFGGDSGNDADWLLLTISGYAAGSLTNTIDFYLADYRFADNALDYIVDDWRHVDFTALGTVDEIRFSLSSSDNGTFGMNTPAYFAMDNFLAVPEPSPLLAALSGLALAARRKRR